MRFLGPGDYLFERCEDSVSIILGSCVALVAWQPEYHWMMASHIMLPGWPQQQESDLRYAGVVLDIWDRDCLRLGWRQEGFRIGVFGGCSRMPGRRDNEPGIGDKNVDFVMDALHARGLMPQAQDVRGPLARRLVLDGQLGRYWSQTLTPLAEVSLREEGE